MQSNQGTVEYFKVLWSVPQSIKKKTNPQSTPWYLRRLEYLKAFYSLLRNSEYCGIFLSTLDYFNVIRVLNNSQSDVEYLRIQWRISEY